MGFLPNEISVDCITMRWTHIPKASHNLKLLQLVQIMPDVLWLQEIFKSILKSKFVPTECLRKETFHFKEGTNCCVFPTG